VHQNIHDDIEILGLLTNVILDVTEDEKGALNATFTPDLSQDDPRRSIVTTMLTRRFRRLNRFQNVILNENLRDKIPAVEWDLTMEYFHAIRDSYLAGLRALNAVPEEVDCEQRRDKTSFCSLFEENHYEEFDEDFDLLQSTAFCEHTKEDIVEDYFEGEPISSHHNDFESYSIQQYRSEFEQDVEEEDLWLDRCLFANGDLKACQSFRPQVYEHAVHLPAQYVGAVERVLFVSSEGSMLLHELLKYPSLKKVVGIAEDQDRVRQAMKIVYAAPHFDDDRVDWWFGNPTDILGFLSETEAESFDMVIALEPVEDISSLQRLVAPNGILLLDGLHMKGLEQMFQYRIQVFVDAPYICRQYLTLASKTVDFFDKELQTFDIETFSYEQHDSTDSLRYLYIHDYERLPDDLVGSVHRIVGDHGEDGPIGIVGAMLVLEFEGLSKKSESNAEPILKKALRQVKTDVNYHKMSGKTSFVTMADGYLVMRCVAKEGYCGIDVHMWSRIESLGEIEIALRKAFKPQTVSSYRLFTPGLHSLTPVGRTTETPQGVKDRRVDRAWSKGMGIERTVAKRSLAYFSIMEGQREELMVMVLCGSEDETCTLMQAAEKNAAVSDIKVFRTCPNLHDENQAKTLQDMIACEKSLTRELEAWFSGRNGERIDVVMLDPSASSAMIQVLGSILLSPLNQEKWLNPLKEDYTAFLTLTNEEDSMADRFLERYLVEMHNRPPSARTELLVRGDDFDFSLHVVHLHAHGHARLIEKVLRMELGNETTVDVVNVRGGIWDIETDDANPRSFSFDYDESTTETFEQTEDQVVVGVQFLLHFRLTESTNEALVLDKVQEALESEFTNLRSSKRIDNDAVRLLVVIFEEAEIVISTLNMNQLIMDVFSSTPEAESYQKSLSSFVEAMKESMELITVEEQPRGYGRVATSATGQFLRQGVLTTHDDHHHDEL